MLSRTIGSTKPGWWALQFIMMIVCVLLAVSQGVFHANAQDLSTPTADQQTSLSTDQSTDPSSEATSFVFPTATPDISAQASPGTVEANLLAAESMAQLDENDTAFTDSQNGYVYLAPKLFWTSDGGSNWSEITPAGLGTPNSVYIQFLDTHRGFILADLTQPNATPAYELYITLDGGSSWFAQQLNLPYPDGELLSFESSSIFFIDERTGWISLKMTTGSNFSRGLLFKTDDGGATWTLKSEPIGGPVYFVDAQAGWIAGGPAGNEVYRTLNGGDSWEAIELPDGGLTISIQLPNFSDEANGILPVISNLDEMSEMLLYQTTDGGATWQLASTVALVSSDEGLAFSFSDKKEKKISIASDQTIISSDGKNASSVKAERGMSATPKKIFLFDDQSGFSELEQSTCIADSPGGNGKIHCKKEYKLLRTNDGGKTWLPVVLPVSDATSTVAAANFSVETMADSTDLTATSANSLFMIGQGFDKCDVASLSQFQTWINNSPYRATNLYLGGISRACSNIALTSSLMHNAGLMGWKFIPTWVGPQAPCSGLKYPISSVPDGSYAAAYAQGVQNAQDAVNALYILGLTDANKSGSVIYYDMEYYNASNNTACAAAVRSFMSGWSATINATGNIPGVYGTTSYDQLDNIFAAANPPLVIWPARYYSSSYKQDASVWDIPELDNGLYINHQRIRQYTAGHNETWGGITMNIDSNVLDGVVAIPQVTQPPSCPPTTESQSYVCNPTLSPTYSNTCSSSWYPILGFNGLSTYLAENVVLPASPTNSAIWKPNLLVDGYYQVEVFIAAHGSSSVTCGSSTKTYGRDSSAANYVIEDKNATKTIVTIDQLPVNNDWVSLGSYLFAKGGNGGYVYLNNSTLKPNSDYSEPNDTNISVGAVRFVAIDPEIASISPISTYAGATGFSLTITGKNFAPGAVVRWNGSDRPTTFVNSQTLNAQIGQSDVALLSVNKVTVHNLNEGSNDSPSVNFTVTTFADVGPNAWYWRYVEGFYKAGLSGGCAITPLRFCPDRAVTRAEMAVFLLRALNPAGYVPTAETTALFTDVPVPGKESMQPWIEQFYLNGITSGCASLPLRYCPERQVTRAEMAVFILRAIHGNEYTPPAKTDIFSDVPIAGKEWMQPWIEQLYREGITTGCGTSPLRYCPEKSVTRAEMSIFIDKAFQLAQAP